MRSTEKRLRKMVTIAVITIFVLLVSAVWLSISWPQSWNPVLRSLFLNIAASLIGVLVGILVAMFVVERHLEDQRRETRKKEHLWKVHWLYGGLSVLTAMIMHLSFFLLYGKRKWQALMISDSEQTEVPERIGNFMRWLIYTKDKCRPSVTKVVLGLFEKGFNETPESPIKIDRRDLGMLINYMETCAIRIRDQMLLFQPFIAEYFELASTLIFFARSLENAAHDSEFSLALTTDKGKLPATFHLDNKGQNLFHSLGKEAVKVSKLVLADYTVESAEGR